MNYAQWICMPDYYHCHALQDSLYMYEYHCHFGLTRLYMSLAFRLILHGAQQYVKGHNH